MLFLPAVLMLSIAATSDSFVIGMGFGLKNVRISFFSNLYISLVCFAGTSAAMLLGRYVGRVLPLWLTESLGAIVLLGLGLWMLIECLRRRDGSMHGICTDPDCVDKDQSKRVELKESMTIGLVLALNNMGLGIGAGISGLPILLTALLCATASFAFVGIGYRVGKHLAPGRFSKVLEVLSALLVIWLGVRAFPAL